MSNIKEDPNPKFWQELLHVKIHIESLHSFWGILKGSKLNDKPRYRLYIVKQIVGDASTQDILELSPLSLSLSLSPSPPIKNLGDLSQGLTEPLNTLSTKYVILGELCSKLETLF